MTPDERFERLRREQLGGLKRRRGHEVPDVWLRAASFCEDMRVAGFVLTAYETHATWERTPHEAIVDVVWALKKHKRAQVPKGALQQALTAMREVGLVDTLIPGGPSLDAWLDATQEERDAEMAWVERQLLKGTPREREAARRFKEIRQHPMASLEKTLEKALEMPDEWWTRPLPIRQTTIVGAHTAATTTLTVVDQGKLLQAGRILLVTGTGGTSERMLVTADQTVGTSVVVQRGFGETLATPLMGGETVRVIGDANEESDPTGHGPTARPASSSPADDVEGEPHIPMIA